MSMSDPIADFLTRIRNAQMAHKPSVSCPSSKIKLALCMVLEEEGFISGYAVDDNAGKSVINVELKYFQDRPVIEEIKRISRPGLRVYKGKNELPKVKDGLGIAIVSTPSGIMSDSQARNQGVGGEILCTVS